MLAGRSTCRPCAAPTQRSRGADTHDAVVNAFLTTKRALYEAGERSPHTINMYVDICEELLVAFGGQRLLADILPEDFEKLRGTWAKK